MKIGIVTLPLHTNYGGLLQAYALQLALERLGHEVVHLQPEVVIVEPHSIWKMPLVYCKRAIIKYLGGQLNTPVFTHPRKWIRKFTDKFIAKYIKCRYLNRCQWSEGIAGDYGAVIFGSDQIWRPIYAYPIEKYFGSFLGSSSVKRISYAASFGTEENEYTEEQLSQCRELLSRFDAISVREQSAVAICKERFGVNAKHAPDPTLLLSKEDYISIFEQANTPKSKGSLAVYILDENANTDAFVENISSQKGFVPFRINSKVENYNAPLSKRQQPPVERWLRAFYDAEYVITDSFHACVFSIIFHKPFICIGNKCRGMSRFESLLSSFSLCDRLVDIDDLGKYVGKEIDWAYVDSVLSDKQQDAFEFLTDALQN